MSSRMLIVSLSLPLLASTGGNGFADSHGRTGTSGDQRPTPNLFTAVVEPGKGAICQAPCRIHYRTPALGSPVEVVVNNFPVGHFEPGIYADLGDYNDLSVRIIVPDSEVPAAYVSIVDK